MSLVSLHRRILTLVVCVQKEHSDLWQDSPTQINPARLIAKF